MKLIHYSSELIESLEPRYYDQNLRKWQAKPNGLWLSVEDENVGYNWKEWCESEKFRLECLEFSYEIKLKENANVIHLKTSEDIFKFTKEHPLKTRDWDAEWDTYQLDWNKIREKYQGIIISPYQWKCRLALESSWYYGWDCTSGCIWDLNCIEEFRKI
jgi:hypothetical protein